MADFKLNPDFLRFLDELRTEMPEIDYKFGKGKARSCDWIINQIESGQVGVDVGGTGYLCKELAAKGVDITYFDLMPSKDHAKSVADDMLNVSQHFKKGSLDFITTRHTLEHSLVPMFQLWMYNELLKDDGRLFIILPIHHPKWIRFPTHYNCLPYENWTMLFYRAGFKVLTSDAGSWKDNSEAFIEYRFVLQPESREMRLGGEAYASRKKAAA